MEHLPTRSSERYSALRAAVQSPHRKVKPMTTATGRVQPVSEYFGNLTFGLAQMREKLPREAYQGLVRTLENGKRLEKDTADAIATVVKEWSVAHGASHFCHWFQPMTGLTAEKHDSFISIQHTNHSELRVIERFSGNQLIQGEPDASSFPSGGMRSTFEARGYTAWDPTSPIFIYEEEGAKTLCIPTVFFGYHGQALDNKTPLLRSIEALNREACDFLKLVGDVDAKRVTATLGAEQEYFLIDKNLVAMRPDIIMAGRTLLGAPSVRGQQLEDHYFGSIPSRIKNYMSEVEMELYKLGIPVKTRHNEVAPSQFELAPIFEDANISSDHNSLAMEVLKRTALKHGLVCLLHEKPFAEINGNGKHCNWSMSNDKGENLLEPGKTPHQNLRFLAVLSVVLNAVYEHADMLRCTIASPGNDHRLGANEAPPAIISVFVGSLLNQILEDIEAGKTATTEEGASLDLGLEKIPKISKDYTDRNRTSPFAFTGNKFEFRAVGSSNVVSVPVCVLNAAVADSFKKANSRLKALLSEKTNRNEAVFELIKEFVTRSKNIRFEGNNYSDEWAAEAEKRGLPLYPSSAEALLVYQDPKANAFLKEMKILNEDELQSRFHVAVERYVKTLDIEIRTLCELVSTYVVPAVEKHLRTLYNTNNGVTSKSLKSIHTERVEASEKILEAILKGIDETKEVIKELESDSSETDKMAFLAAKGKKVAEDLRAAADSAETIISDDLWPLPKYREMLFADSLS